MRRSDEFRRIYSSMSLEEKAFAVAWCVIDSSRENIDFALQVGHIVAQQLEYPTEGGMQ